MKILLIQPHAMRVDLGGGRSPTNRSGTIYKILINELHKVTIGTTIVNKDMYMVRNNVKLINESTKYNYDLIVMLSGTMGYCFPPRESFDDRKRCIHALLNTDCPVVFIQDEYITQYCGYPADISRLSRIKDCFKEHDTHKGRDIKILMQSKYPKSLANKVTDNMNKYNKLNYQFINWGVQMFAFHKMPLMQARENTTLCVSYVGVMRPNRSRLELINNKRTSIFGRWKYPMSKVRQFGKARVLDVPDILNDSCATIWTHDDDFINMSVESARLYEAPRCGCPLLIDKIMWKNIEDCYLYESDCFYSSKMELWEKIAKLYKDKKYRINFIEQQQELYINSFRLRDEISKFLLLLSI